MGALRDARNRVLAILQAHPQGIRSDRLAEEANTPRSQARIGELRKAGWRITTSYDGSSGLAIYTLVGRKDPKPLPDAAFKVKVCGKKVEIQPYGQNSLSGNYGEHAQHDLAKAIRKAVDTWLEDHTPYQTATDPLPDPEPVQEDLLAMLDGSGPPPGDVDAAPVEIDEWLLEIDEWLLET